MLRFTIFFVLFFSIEKIFGQIYTVPFAQVQPKWVMPLWFENGDGQRDTLYFCYNSINPYPLDTLLGQKLIKEDPSLFNMTFSNLLFNDSMHQKATIFTADILDQGVAIFSQNIIMPLTLRWDRNVFYSDSIPFPDQDPAPRAEGRMWFDLPTYVDSCSYSVPILMTDTAQSAAYCHKADSVIFYGPALSYLVFSVHPWKGIILSVQSQIEDYGVYCSTNLSTNRIEVNLPHSNFSGKKLKLVDIVGRVVMDETIESTHEEIDISALPIGLYFLVVTDNNFPIYKTKFIKP